jgi:hypothetical protein
MTTKELLNEASKKLYEGCHALAKIRDTPDYNPETMAVPPRALRHLID